MGFFSKKPTSTALAKYVAPAAESLMDPEEAIKFLDGFIKRKVVRGAIEGGIGGGVLGGGVGYFTAKEKQDQGAVPLAGAALGAVIGAGMGAPLWATGKLNQAGLKVMGAKRGYNTNAAKILRKNKKGVYEYTTDLAKDIFSDPDIAKHVDDMEIPKLNYFGRPTGSMYSVEEKRQGLKEIVNRYKSPNEDLSAIISDSINQHNIRTTIERNVMHDVIRNYQKNDPGKAVRDIASRLKSQGVSDFRDFVRKYHPDKNPNAPVDVKNHFHEILSVMRSPSVGETPIDKFMDGFKRRQEDYTRKANQAIRDLK